MAPWQRIPGAALLGLAGCSTAPVSAPPLAPAVPAAWSAPPAGVAVRVGPAWWRRFDDHTLDQLTARAMLHNTSVEEARAALRSARASRAVAAASLWPAVDGTLTAERSKAGAAGASDVANASVGAAWEPDVFGARRAALQAGASEAQASAANLGALQLSVAADVAASYIALRGAQARLAIARENLANYVETRVLTAWRVQAGLLTVLEAEQANAASAQAAAQLPLLETAIAQLQHALAVLCGATPQALSAHLVAIRPIPDAGADPAPGVPAELLRQRPDVRAAEYQVSAALARVGQADAARYPLFRLAGTIGLRSPGTPTRGVHSLLTSLLGSVASTLFDGGAARAQVQVQQGALDQARARYRYSVLNALREVEDGLTALAGERTRLAQLRLAAAAAESAALLARQRYGGGLVDFQTVLETQRSLFSSRDQVASSATSVGIGQVRLFQALGGGWRDDTGTARMREDLP
jgi:multidrug efflux system outer membrane protein